MDPRPRDEVEQALWERQRLGDELRATPQHLYPLSHAFLQRSYDALNERLAQLAAAPPHRVALKRHYEESHRLEDELQDLGPGERYGY